MKSMIGLSLLVLFFTSVEAQALDIEIRNETNATARVKFVAARKGATATTEVGPRKSANDPQIKPYKISPPIGEDQVIIAWKNGKTIIGTVVVPWQALQANSGMKLAVFINEDTVAFAFGS